MESGKKISQFPSVCYDFLWACGRCLHRGRECSYMRSNNDRFLKEQQHQQYRQRQQYSSKYLNVHVCLFVSFVCGPFYWFAFLINAFVCYVWSLLFADTPLLFHLSFSHSHSHSICTSAFLYDYALCALVFSSP